MFCCFGRGGGSAGPAQTANKRNTPPPKQQKKKNAPPLPSVLLFLLFGRVGVLSFCSLGGGGGRGVHSFFAVWAGGVFLFCCLGGGPCFFVFCCLGRGRVVFLLFGRGGRGGGSGGGGGGACFFLLFGRGMGVHSLTGLPGLSSSDPTTKKTKQQKKKHGFPCLSAASSVSEKQYIKKQLLELGPPYTCQLPRCCRMPNVRRLHTDPWVQRLRGCFYTRATYINIGNPV